MVFRAKNFSNPELLFSFRENFAVHLPKKSSATGEIWRTIERLDGPFPSGDGREFISIKPGIQGMGQQPAAGGVWEISSAGGNSLQFKEVADAGFDHYASYRLQGDGNFVVEFETQGVTKLLRYNGAGQLVQTLSESSFGIAAEIENNAVLAATKDGARPIVRYFDGAGAATTLPTLDPTYSRVTPVDLKGKLGLLCASVSPTGADALWVWNRISNQVSKIVGVGDNLLGEAVESLSCEAAVVSGPREVYFSARNSLGSRLLKATWMEIESFPAKVSQGDTVTIRGAFYNGPKILVGGKEVAGTVSEKGAAITFVMPNNVLGQVNVQVVCGTFFSNTVSVLVEKAAPLPPPPPPSPAISPGGIVDGASLLNRGSVAQGGIIAVFGDNFTDGCKASSPQMPLSRSLCSAQLLLDNQAIPLYYIEKTQVNAQVPFDFGVPATVHAQVVRNGVAGNIVTVDLKATAPALFTYNGSGTVKTAIATDVNGALTTLKAGKHVVFWGAGLGYTAGNPRTGEASPLNAVTYNRVRVELDGKEIPVEWAGLTPGMVGLYQINVWVPEDFAPTQILVPGVIKTDEGSSAFYALADVAVQP